MNPARILVVDDEAALKNFSHLLRKEGYEITACQSGATGLKEPQQHEFDVVLSELRMNLDFAVGVGVGANLFAQTSVRINSHLQSSRNGLNRNEFLCQLRNPG